MDIDIKYKLGEELWFKIYVNQTIKAPVNTIKIGIDEEGVHIAYSFIYRHPFYQSRRMETCLLPEDVVFRTEEELEAYLKYKKDNNEDYY